MRQRIALDESVTRGKERGDDAGDGERLGHQPFVELIGTLEEPKRGDEDEQDWDHGREGDRRFERPVVVAESDPGREEDDHVKHDRRAELDGVPSHRLGGWVCRFHVTKCTVYQT